MVTYAIKRNFPGLTYAELLDIQKAATEACEKLTKEGIKVKYIRSELSQDSSFCICFFEAINEEAVRAVIGDTPHAEITKALNLAALR